MVDRFGLVVISLRRERFTPGDQGKKRAGELLKNLDFLRDLAWGLPAALLHARPFGFAQGRLSLRSG
jgi:hypothetical protein